MATKLLRLLENCIAKATLEQFLAALGDIVVLEAMLAPFLLATEVLWCNLDFDLGT